jgi:dipeptidyl aminopeptidase/acylaminoacyl peptidase
MPPTLLLHGTADVTVPRQQSLNYRDRLRRAGVSCELMTIERAPHGLLTWGKLDPAYPAKMIAWLNRTLGVAPRATP